MKNMICEIFYNLSNLLDFLVVSIKMLIKSLTGINYTDNLDNINNLEKDINNIKNIEHINISPLEKTSSNQTLIGTNEEITKNAIMSQEIEKTQNPSFFEKHKMKIIFAGSILILLTVLYFYSEAPDFNGGDSGSELSKIKRDFYQDQNLSNAEKARELRAQHIQHNRADEKIIRLALAAGEIRNGPGIFTYTSPRTGTIFEINYESVRDLKNQIASICLDERFTNKNIK